MKIIKVFLASSSELMKYRECATKIIDEINCTIGQHFGVLVQLFRWEKEVMPAMGRPQQIIFDQSEFKSIDIFVGIFGARFGTPTGGFDVDSIAYESGTQEEFDRAYNMYREEGKPYIMIFHCTDPLKPGSFDVNQYQKVLTFLKQFEASQKTPGIYCKFRGQASFVHEFRIAVTKAVLDLIEKNSVSISNKNNNTSAELSADYQCLGFKKLYVPETNSMRSIAKCSSIEHSSFVCLLAKTGNSFLGSLGNRYLDLLIENTRNGSSVRILLLNPWSINAVTTALLESGDVILFQKFLRWEVPSQQIIEAYKRTKWFSAKLMDVIQEYGRLKSLHPGIELRFIDTDVSASILITDKDLYYEPYCNFINRNRMSKKTSTFEVVISKDTQIYADSLAQFDLLWINSISFTDLFGEQQLYINRLARSIDSMYDAKNSTATAN